MAKQSIKPKPVPSQEELNELLRYDAETGRLFWKERSASLFQTKRAANIWNAQYPGKEAFTAYNAYGYREGRIFNGLHRAHRIIWAMHFGNASDDIDHINGDRSDNRLSNLRAVTRSENRRNCAVRSDNSTGVTGVKKRKYGWQAYIGTHTIGNFKTFEDAVVARKAAEAEFGFHPNHGRPAV